MLPLPRPYFPPSPASMPPGSSSDPGHAASNRLPALHNFLNGESGMSGDDTEYKPRSLPSLRSLNILPSSSAPLSHTPYGTPPNFANASPTMDFVRPNFRAATSNVRDSSHSATWPRRKRDLSECETRPHRSTSASSSVASMTSSSSYTGSTNTASSEHHAINGSMGTRYAPASATKLFHLPDQSSSLYSYNEDVSDPFAHPHPSSDLLRQQLLPLSLDSSRPPSPFSESTTPILILSAGRESRSMRPASGKSGSTTPLNYYPPHRPEDSSGRLKSEKSLLDLLSEEPVPKRQYLKHGPISAIGSVGQDVTAYQRVGFSPRRTSSKYQILPSPHYQSLFDPNYSPFHKLEQPFPYSTSLSSRISGKLPDQHRLYLEPVAASPNSPAGSHGYQTSKSNPVAEATSYRNKRPLRSAPSSSYHFYDSSTSAMTLDPSAPFEHETEAKDKYIDNTTQFERPFACPGCERTFARRYDRNRHARRHTGEKPYVCRNPNCEEEFIRPDALQRHYRCNPKCDIFRSSPRPSDLPTR